MKKIFVFVVMALFAMSAIPVHAKYEPIEKAFELRTMPDSTKVLYVQGKPFKGTRIQMLAKVATILGQSNEKHLLLLNQEGTGGGLGKADNRLLLMQHPKTKQWHVVAESYQLMGTIIGAYDPSRDLKDLTVFIQDTAPQRVDRVFIQKPF